jgi:hypothetical protein
MDESINSERPRMVTGMFRDRESAEHAYKSITDRGYTNDDVSLVMSDETRKRHFVSDKTVGETELGTKAMEDAGKGGVIGGTVGAIAAAIAAIGTSLVIPGLGLVVAGPIAAGLAGAGAGGGVGALIGGLVGAGIPEERAKVYEKGVKEGGIVMGVHPRSDEEAEALRREWERNHGENVDYY